MAAAKKGGAKPPETVEAFLRALDHPLAAGIRALRKRILALDPRIGEGIKWNAPSFFLEDHFATFKLRPETKIFLVLHTGAKPKARSRPFEVPDPAGLLTWPAKDRALLTLASSAEVKKHGAAIDGIVRSWISQL